MMMKSYHRTHNGPICFGVSWPITTSVTQWRTTPTQLTSLRTCGNVTTRRRCRPSTSVLFSMSAGTSDNNNAMKLMEERKKVVDLLRDDLLKQYETPMQLNWDLYDDNITFDDPSTTLSGKTMYKGMLITIGVIFVKGLFKDAQFLLPKCELVQDEDGWKIQTHFETKGTTKWGAFVEITGVDHFWFAPDSPKIVRHQSQWDQTPQFVTDSFLGKLTKK